MNENCEPVTLVVIAPVPDQEQPNFDIRGQKGLNVCWGMYKRQKRTQRATPRLLAMASAIAHSWRPDFPLTPDGKQVCSHMDYLEGVDQEAQAS